MESSTVPILLKMHKDLHTEAWYSIQPKIICMERWQEENQCLFLYIDIQHNFLSVFMRIFFARSQLQHAGLFRCSMWNLDSLTRIESKSTPFKIWCLSWTTRKFLFFILTLASKIIRNFKWPGIIFYNRKKLKKEREKEMGKEEGRRRGKGKKEERKQCFFTYLHLLPSGFYLILLPNAGEEGRGLMGHELTSAFHSWALKCLQSIAGQGNLLQAQ